MLYKNDEVYKMTMADHQKIHKMYPKLPIRLIYPENRVRKSRSKHNKLPDKPTSISFPFVAVVKTTTGTETWRYAEHRIVGNNGQVTFTPHTLTDKDMELIFWLVNCCPVLEGGKNNNGKVAKCAIEDLIGIAERKVQKEAGMADVKALLFSNKVGLNESRMRQVAKAYFIPQVDELTFAQIRLALEVEINRDKIEGVQKFLKMIEHDQTLEVRSLLMEAVDSKIISFMLKTRMWAWVTEQGKKNIPIVQTSVGVDPNEALFEYYLGDRQFAQDLVSAVKGEKVLIPEGAGSPHDQE